MGIVSDVIHGLRDEGRHRLSGHRLPVQPESRQERNIQLARWMSVESSNLEKLNLILKYSV